MGRGGGTEAPNEAPLGIGGEGEEAMAMQEADGFSFPFMMSSQGKASSCAPWMGRGSRGLQGNGVEG